MDSYCTFIPKIGKSLMQGLRKQFDYETAKKIFLTATNPNFIADYKHTLSLDAEGVPSLESVMKNAFIRDMIGTDTMLKSLNRREALEDTMENYATLLEEAYNFNSTNENRDRFTSYVDYAEDGKLTVKVVERTDDSVNKFQQQYREHQLNDRLAKIFSPIGITVGSLTDTEKRMGRVGVTDFTQADKIATDFVSIIRVANNKEGAQAISEEFAHLIIGTLSNNVLIQRALNVLKSKPELVETILGNQYEDIVQVYDNDQDLIAEEALGHILKDNLVDVTTIAGLTERKLFERAIKNTVDTFKQFDDEDVNKALNEVNALMNSVAKSILDGGIQISEQDIENSKRLVKLNALSDRVARDIAILKKATEVEAKRYKISKNASTKDYAQKALNTLTGYANENADTVLGICLYAKSAIEQMKSIRAELKGLSGQSTQKVFAALRSARSYIASYGTFIQQMEDLLVDAENENEDTYFKTIVLSDSEGNTTEVSVSQLIKDLSHESKQLTSQYVKIALPSFGKFLQAYLGDKTITKLVNGKAQELTVEELLSSADKDISFMDRWLDAMGDSSDMLLQLFDKVVKTEKDKARMATIDAIRRIQALRQEAESLGIKDFEWMFEKDSDGNKSGDYISPTNKANFYKALKDLNASLDEEYGKNPRGQAAVDKLAKKHEWLAKYALSEFGKPEPKDGYWKNEDYEKLSDAQRTILDKFLTLKREMDKKLPDGKTYILKGIQIRKSSAQRLIESGTSPSSILENIKGYYQEAFLDKVDDDQIFGASYRSGLTDFEGHEYLVLPVLYTGRLENPNEISTDVFSSLMQYAYMANQYKAMDGVVDALEVGRDMVKTNRQVKSTRGNLPVIEKIKDSIAGKISTQVTLTKSNIEAKLDDFMECQVYQRYLKDSGTFEVFGKQVNANKLTSFILNRSSFAQLGFNWLANIANVATGACMQHIECAANEYFGVKELARADAEYTKMMTSFLPELGSRVKQSKLALFDELIDFKGDFRTRLKNGQTSNWLQRLFGENIAFLGQDGGDHWMYNRTAIAMALKQRVIVPGKGEMSLWDALEIVEVGTTGLKKMQLPSGTTDTNGKAFKITDFSRKVLHVNQSLFGVYNDEDSNAANRVIAGRLLQQYRKWIKPQYNKRFQAAQQNLATNSVEEGYYRTVLRILNELRRGEVQLAGIGDQLQDWEKANVRRAICEIAQLIAVWALVNFIEWPDDKERPWALKMAEYASTRLLHELGGLAPSPIMAQEMVKNFKNPLPATSVATDMINLACSVVDPRDWVDELQSGPYKGHSTLERNLMKAPIPGIRQYRMVEKTIGELDTSISYYARPY